MKVTIHDPLDSGRVWSIRDYEASVVSEPGGPVAGTTCSRPGLELDVCGP
jgi:hypothetical protein